jgi:hypothetical protein
MHLYIQGAIPVGGLLKVETARAMYLGEVAAIWPQPSDGYTAVLMFVEHMLPSCVRPESSQRSAA